MRRRVPKWNHLAAAWESLNPNSQSLPVQAVNGTPCQIPRLTRESQSLPQNRVARIWYWKRQESVLPVTYWTQEAEIVIESLWALYSDGQQSEKTVGLYPNTPSYIFFQASLFITENNCAVRGFEIQGKLDKNLQHSCPCKLAVPRLAVRCLSLPAIQWLGCLQLCPRRWSVVSPRSAEPHSTCSSWNNSFNIRITY